MGLLIQPSVCVTVCRCCSQNSDGLWALPLCWQYQKVSKKGNSADIRQSRILAYFPKHDLLIHFTLSAWARVEWCTLSQQITKSSPWSTATCSMINPVLNLGASARTNRVLWRYVSRQLSQAVVRQINSFTLDWMSNRGLARPVVTLIEHPPKPKGTEEFPASHFLSVSLLSLHSQAHVWFANRLLFQKVSFAPSQTKLARPPGKVYSYFWHDIWICEVKGLKPSPLLKIMIQSWLEVPLCCIDAYIMGTVFLLPQTSQWCPLCKITECHYLLFAIWCLLWECLRLVVGCWLLLASKPRPILLLSANLSL